MAYAQYGLSAFMEYERTGDPTWLASAIRHGEALIEMHIERDGAWWYPYDFKWTYYQRTLNAPWWSLMAQGEALSLYTRLATETGDPDGRWREAADRTWESFPQQYASPGPWGSLVIEDHLYLEAFASDNQAPLLVANTHVFAMFGLYDYWRLTGNAEARPILRRRGHHRARSHHAAGAGRGRGHELLRPGRVLPEPALAERALSPHLRRAAGDPRRDHRRRSVRRLVGDLLASDWQPPFEAARGFDLDSHFEPGVEPLEMGAIRP